MSGKTREIPKSELILWRVPGIWSHCVPPSERKASIHFSVAEEKNSRRQKKLKKLNKTEQTEKYGVTEIEILTSLGKNFEDF